MVSMRNCFAMTVVALALVAKVSQGIFLEEVKVVKKIPTTHKVVALTVDDGPHYKTTPDLLKVLKEKNVKVTMFVLGQNVKEHPELVAQAAQDGHEIATHAYTHNPLTKMSQAECAAELDKTEAILKKIEIKPHLFRPPGGLYNDAVIKEADKHSYTTVLWSVDPKDWQRPSVEKVVNTVTTTVEPGSIVLLHDGQYPLPTPQAIGQIIDNLRANGYTFVTISELLEYYEVRETGLFSYLNYQKILLN
jgi:peptidoglycan/xylan/chitin deacetylase (PgdA/CDA1 family)